MSGITPATTAKTSAPKSPADTAVRFLQMKRDCFDTIHPTAAIIYFGFALAMPMLLLHPMLLGISFLSALAWTVQLNGMRDALRFFCRFILPLMLLTAILNPIFNHKGP